MTLGALNVLDARFDDCGGGESLPRPASAHGTSSAHAAGLMSDQSVRESAAAGIAGVASGPQSPFLLDLDDRRELPSFRPLLLIMLGLLSLAIYGAGCVW